MKYYSKIINLKIFTLNDVVNITKSISAANQLISSYIKNHYIERIKKNLYASIDPITDDIYVNNYEIASNITANSFLSYHSAFEFYSHYNQIFNNISVSSSIRFQPFSYKDVIFDYIHSDNNLQIDKIGDVKVTSLERTIVDSIDKLGKVIDTEELTKCIESISFINEEKIKQILEFYDKDILYRKVGYFLSFFKNKLQINDSFFTYCKKKSNIQNIGKISSKEINQLVLINEWGLYGYSDLLNLINKGGDEDV